MRLKVLAAVALIVVGVGAVGLAVFQPSFGGQAASQYLTATVGQGNVVAQSVATGTIAPTAYYGLTFGADPQLAAGVSTSTASSGSSGSSSSGTSSGGGTGSSVWPVTSVAVKVGDQVKAGQTLAEADASNAQVQVAIAKATLASAKARLTVDSGGPQAIVVAQARDAVIQSNLALQSASHSRASTLTQNTMAVTVAEQQLADAQASLATTQAGPTADVVAAAQDSVDQAQQNLAQAQQNLASVQAQQALSVQAAQNSYETAVQKAGLDAQLPAATPAPTGTPGPTPTVNPLTSLQDNAAVASAATALQSAQTQSATAIQNAQNQVTNAQLALKAAQDKYTSTVTPSQASITAAQQAVQAAQQKLDQSKQSQTSAITQLNDQLASAQQQLIAAQHGFQAKIAPATPDVIASDKATVTSAESNVTSAEKTLAHARLVAPADGTVVSVNVQPNIDAPSGFAVVLQSNTFEVTASYAEGDVINLKLGQPATVTVTSSNSTLDGTVSQITPVGSTASGNSVVSYNVSVTLGDPPATILTGMSANVAVTTASADNVLTVPSTALVGAGGNYFVRVLGGNGQPQVVPVQVGLVTSSLAQVMSGLNDGETVVVGTVSQRTQTATGAGGINLGGGLGGGAFRGGGAGGNRGGAGGAGAGGTGGGAGQ